VNGAAYVGTRIGFNQLPYREEKDVRAQVKRYCANPTVTVYFNPEKPADAVLVREFGTFKYAVIAIAGFSCLALALAIPEFRDGPDLRTPNSRTQSYHQPRASVQPKADRAASSPDWKVYMLRLVYAVFFLFLWGIYLWFFVFFVRQRKTMRASLSWPQVTGTIGGAIVERRSGRYGASYYVPRATYLYDVYGVPYMGTRIGFNQRTYSERKDAQAALDPYPEKSTVTVYYDPKTPAQAVLVPQPPTMKPAILMGFGFCFLTALPLIAVLADRRFPPNGGKRIARTQTYIQPSLQPWVPPPLVKEPVEDVHVVPKFEPKAEPKVIREVGAKIEPKAEPKGDRAASFELYAALRDKKPVPVIEALLNRNPMLNGVSRFNVPLVAAAEGCEPEAARLLLAKGADPNAPYTKGMAAKMNQPTALMAAGANGCVSVAQLLLESGANPNVTTAQPALVEAIQHKSEQMARLLLDHGADPNAHGQAGPTPLGAAAFDGNDALVRLLLARGAKVNQPDGSGVTPLMLAVSSGNADAVDQLLARGASVNARDRKGTTALGYTKNRQNSPQMQRIIVALRTAGANE
jgi:hypothetical protein